LKVYFFCILCNVYLMFSSFVSDRSNHSIRIGDQSNLIKNDAGLTIAYI